MVSHPSVMIIYLKVGLLNTKGMPCYLLIEYCSLLIMDTSGHGLMGGFSGKSGLGLCFRPLDLFWMLPLDPSLVGSLLLTFAL